MNTSVQITRRSLLAGMIATAGGLALASCSSGGGSSSSGNGLTITVAGQSDNLTQVFNPFLENTALGVTYNGSFIYEPLVQINTADIGKDIPWLAKSWEWSNDNKTFTVTLQDNVKWTDGKPFSADDVVFTYQLLQKFPALNLQGVPAGEVSSPAPNKVVFTFKDPSEQLFPSIVSAPIVAKHLWESVKDPTSHQDPNPVGTGAFKVGQFSPQSLLLTRNDDYWQPKAQIAAIRFVPYKDNSTVTNAMVQGQADWAGTYIANADKTFTSKSKNYHFWAPRAGTDGLIPNLERWPLSDIAVRKAISLGVNRKQVAAASGEQPATSVTGLPLPTYQSSVSAQYKGVGFVEDKAKAMQTLEAAGYAKGSDGYYAKGGKRVEFSCSFPAAYTEIAARVQVLVSQLKDIGIKLNIDTTTVDDINPRTAKGDFDSTMGYPVSPTPRAFSFYNDTMNPNLYYPIGQSTPSFQNIERFKDDEAAELFKQYPLATTDEARQQILDKIETVFVEKLPWIPMFYWGSYSSWSTARVTGFPDQDNPYFTAVPNVVVALRLKPA
ncbi:ABC transporter substrate-binding protein [Kutzneria kofuensis]|uniref:Peptide/nickel transport system substrate-binding protein n=1 Tax=Kutzneria kofuensis TaxID=103725 RepID=A0A7W9NED9_9PSEU|nr:ABC transporter substrate-binding protein [Kutzneria kofuensis]MBB5888848.1 peptide/nickel transport system substrate-binding protein [Kutzneria kofuensis]